MSSARVGLGVVLCERLWTHEETATWLRISVWTLHHVVSRGEGPPVYLVARRARRYDPIEVREWLRDHRIGGPAGPAGPEDPGGHNGPAGSPSSCDPREGGQRPTLQSVQPVTNPGAAA